MNKPVKIIVALLCVFTADCIAQDTIVKMDAVKIPSKLIDISPTSITFKRYDNIDGPTYRLTINEVESIHFKNGMVRNFYSSSEDLKHKKILADDTYTPYHKRTYRESPLDRPDGKKHRISISLNILQILVSEFGATLDYCYNYQHSIGISILAQYPSPIFNVNLLAGDQAGRWPGFVYNGTVYQINYKLYFTHSRKWSMAPQYMFKTLSYSNYFFMNERKNVNYYVQRSESAKVYGGDLIFAYQITNPQFRGLAEVFFGISYRKKIRDYTTIANYRSDSYIPYTDTDHPLGTFHDEEEYPLLAAGFKIGINTFFK